MINRKTTIISIVSAMLAFSLGIYAQNWTGSMPPPPPRVPLQIPYQGVLERDGELVNANQVEFRVSLYNAEQGGTLLWGPEAHACNVYSGRFSFVIGNQAGLQIDDLNNVESPFLQVDVKMEGDADWVSLAGRQRFLRSPYAISAVASYSDFTVKGGIRFHDGDGSGLGDPDDAYHAGAGNFLSFEDPGRSEDFIGYADNRFYFRDCPGGGDTKDPSIDLGHGNLLFEPICVEPNCLDADRTNRLFASRKYAVSGDTNVLDTGVSNADWFASISGFKATNGDIDEGASGDPIKVYLDESNGTWHITADITSHNLHEDWEVWVLFIRNQLVNR